MHDTCNDMIYVYWMFYWLYSALVTGGIKATISDSVYTLPSLVAGSRLSPLAVLETLKWRKRSLHNRSFSIAFHQSSHFPQSCGTWRPWPRWPQPRPRWNTCVPAPVPCSTGAPDSRRAASWRGSLLLTAEDTISQILPSIGRYLRHSSLTCFSILKCLLEILM